MPTCTTNPEEPYLHKGNAATGRNQKKTNAENYMSRENQLLTSLKLSEDLQALWNRGYQII